jgi:2-polyprenyl-6-hydroxyphenyl methylase / 3-demethylubiquinone-9 3-methyltransferase
MLSLFPATTKNDLELYEREADNWWTPGSKLSILSYFNAPRFSYFDRFVGPWQGLKVLDVGCGGGFTCEFLAKRGAKVTGVDLSEKSIQAARKHAKESGLKIEYLQGKGEKLPVDSGQFDLVVCVDVLEHVEDLGKVLSEINRALKSGGTFLFDTINRTWKSRAVMIWLLEYVLKEIPRGTHDWKLFIRPEELREMLAAAGFSKLDMAGFDFKGVDKKTNQPKVKITEDLSVMYIGKAEKS